MLAIVVGAHLCRSLVHAWKPLYAVDQLSIEQRFLRLASVLDANPYLGLQRTMLEKFLLYLPSYMTAGFRQMVASHYYPTFKRLAIDREQDPQLALQLAAVAGWAGRMPEAIELMDRAIAIQAGHEDVYKALYLKGEYLKELAQSDAGIEPPEKVVALAQQALDCLEESKRRMPHTPQREIVTVRDLYIDECKQLIAAGTLPEPPASRDPGK
jgi:tetratricopeptide (TPR) repeat protein